MTAFSLIAAILCLWGGGGSLLHFGQVSSADAEEHLATSTGGTLTIFREPSGGAACDMWSALTNGTSLANDSGLHAMFQSICSTSNFVSLFEQWGISHFTIGWASADNTTTTITFSFEWVSSCSNASFAPATSCAYQEYWDGHSQNDSVTGPFVTEYGASSYGVPAGSGPPLAPTDWATGTTFLIVAFVAVVAAVAFVARVRARGRRTSSLTDAPAPFLEPSEVASSSPPGSHPPTERDVTTSGSAGDTDTLDDFA